MHIKKKWLGIFIIHIVIIVIITITSVISGSIINVPGGEPTIQAGIDAAIDGDIVLIAPGTYYEDLTLNGKTVTLASWFHTTGEDQYIEQTIIDGGGKTVMKVLNADETNIIGLTIRNGNDGVSTNSTIHILNNHFIGNRDGVDYEGGGGTCSNNLFAYNGDDGIDLDYSTEVTITNNIIRDNDDDGIEIRLQPYSGAMMYIDIRENLISGNGEDGIQLIDYSNLSDRTFLIERNVFAGNAMAAIGFMADGDTAEDFSGAPIPERVSIINNTFSGEGYGVVGGANAIVLNNIFKDIQNSAVRRAAGESIASYNLFWNNGTDYEESNIDLTTTLFADPLLDANYYLMANSPAIDAGMASYIWQGETVLDMPASSYTGSAPDMGAFETGPQECIDNDNDGYGNPMSSICMFPELDCDDNNSEINPGAVEICDGIDNNCYGTADEGETCPGGTSEVRVSAGLDDAEERPSGSIKLTSSDLEMTHDQTDQIVGMRFNGIDIPRGATITNAYIQFQVDEAATVTTSLTIQGEAIDNAPTFSAANWDISSRVKTVEAVNWVPAPWNTKGEAGADQLTPDISPVIQEIVDQSGWVNGNSLVIIITGTGKRVAESFDGVPSAAPLLHVEYSVYVEETICDDEIDNDINGLIDCQDPYCEGVINGSCSTGLPGICEDGSLTCSNGAEICITDIQPGEQQEVCDGIDNDCDGLIDDADPDVTGYSTWYADTDNDIYGDPNISMQACSQPAGYVADNTDCDDSRNDVYPGAAEVCDSLDNDCDSLIDDADPDVTGQSNWYADTDNDTYGDPNSSTQACSQPAGFVADNTDCDDSRNDVYPGAAEVCDSLDNDCDALIDDADPDVTGQSNWYADTDNDTYGDPNISTQTCSQPAGYVADNTDCDDSRNDVYPGAAEICGGLDNDCDSLIDDADPDITGQSNWYTDNDSDTYGNPNISMQACSQPAGYVADNTDCDDSNTSIYPAAPEICDGNDNDCGAGTGDGSGENWYGVSCDGLDADLCEEGIYECVDGTQSCLDVTGNTAEICGDGLDNDCDGTVDELNIPGPLVLNLQPVADATVKSTDPAANFGDNIELEVDASPIKTAYMRFNVTGISGLVQSARLRLKVTNSGPFGGTIYSVSDNNWDEYAITFNSRPVIEGQALDALGAVSKGDIVELDVTTAITGNGTYSFAIDSNSSNGVDYSSRENLTNPPELIITIQEEDYPYYCDDDSDGYAGSVSDGVYTVNGCQPAECQIMPGDDCDDTNGAINPGAVEVCDDIDNDCNELIDDLDPGITGQGVWHADSDTDSYGDPDSTTLACNQPAGYVTDNTDCDDSNTSVYPGQIEVCDGIDDNCDTSIDEGFDLDGDTYTTCGGDCDDSDGTVNPGATERPYNGKDDDCDAGTPDDDIDADGYPVATDCNDNDPAINPGAAEVCDEIDNNCDTSIDEGFDLDGDTYTTCGGDCDDNDALEHPDQTWYEDADGDGYSSGNTIAQCERPIGYKADLELIAISGDCNDNDPAINPGAAEICDGIDNDCDGTVDGPAICTENTLEVRVTTGSDDAEERVSGSVKLSSGDLELTFDGGGNQTVGMRFNGISISPGANITSAYVQFQVDEANSEATSLTIQGEATDNASQFVSSSLNISSRPRTQDNVVWSPVPWTTRGEAGPDQQTPNIVSVIQEIVSRPGWASGNSLVIIVTGTGERTAESYDGNQAGAPLLHVEYH